ncbi:MAG: hypothetical protein ABI999_02325 [Acidobacteriota bacterium]
MRRQLLSIPVIIITLLIGIYIAPFDATRGIRGLGYMFIDAVRHDMASRTPALEPHYGRYGNPGNPIIQIGRNGIRDVKQGESYAFHIISRSADGNSYLIEIYDLEKGSSLRKYEYLEFNDTEWMAYFGYDSMDDYNYGRSSSSGSFEKIYF